MFETLIILAARPQSDDTGAGKIIFGIIFVLIWGFSAFVSWMNKQQQEARRRAEQARQQFQTAAPPVLPPPLPPPILRTLQVPPPPVARRTAKPARQGRRVKAQPPPPTQLTQPIVARPPQPIIPTPVAPRPTGATAPALAHWLRPQTLKSQFILTEVLRPPLALRDDERSL